MTWEKHILKGNSAIIKVPLDFNEPFNERTKNSKD